ncbi:MULTISPECIES: hypothetical protein [unclassified Sulfitobacter]|jgi:hypothetical protein|uniref:holin n=1 Tax=Sulfitobacter phage pCB2047-C TaxID=754043 RepID=UPI0002C05E86|nr:MULTISPECIES: hypothetical protein [unclassified Sulfitobacter]YP_007675274.1 holin [Sulfitobacter phage pCB2047-C]YP_007675458.1 holin [Sulfitobacter phage pCB2047-A]AGG91187.1 molybdopterin binding protein [Sulfitobacter phage pCB2047-C]AGH30792.1 molybdopterin binding protein [Sulfitobacter phage pCB2047-A]PTA99571.1 hypothetical protein C8254_14175 [Sulfitobacter sp. CB-A]ULO21278.1 hypothetical protein IV89_001242 [Sulfitobacter sp. CB2047]|tara:strand:+ start:6577 stop:6774 length:198 start_codon:yes stop_codon:yes gene_type:complete
MKLVSDARNWWKWNSTHVAALLAVAPLAWAQMPADLKSQVPDWAMPYIAGFMFLAFVIARLRDQK